MAKYKKEEVETSQADEISNVLKASVLEIGDDKNLGLNQEQCIQKLQRANKDKVFAWASQESVRFANNGWYMIKLTDGGNSFKIVKSLDEADKTTGNVLAVRHIEVDRRCRAEDEARRIDSNRIARRMAKGDHLASEFDKNLSGFGGIVRASPLSAQDE